MATIHVIYDPNSRVTGMSPEQLKSIGASAIVMQIEMGITIHNIDEVISQCVEMLIERIAYAKAEEKA